MGLETEYGIVLENQPGVDPTEAAQLFFNLWCPKDIPNWDFSTERPSQDARGWLDINTPLESPENAREIKSEPSNTKESLDKDLVDSIKLPDRTHFNAMLSNGARFYIDHAHPEYSTPECSSLRDLIAADVAGQVFLAEVTEQVNRSLMSGQRFSLYRNNTDFHGASYGCHENYQMNALAYEALFGNQQHLLFTFLTPYLVTRQIFCGAGKTGAETGSQVDYQISQRADFIETVVGLQTVYRRPIVNTRDEPHADPRTSRRLHVIVGDTNMAEPTTYLKVGITRLILDMLEAGRIPFSLVLADPVEAIKTVSRDLTCRKPVIKLEGEKSPRSALDIQYTFLNEAVKFLDEKGATQEQKEICLAWQDVLEKLEDDPMQLGQRIDWVIKYQLLESQRIRRNIDWASPVLKELDIKYHAIDPQRSAYHLLKSNQVVATIVSDKEVSERLKKPPEDTRAFLRNQMLTKFTPVAVNWDCVLLYDGQSKRLLRVRLPDAGFSGAALAPSLDSISVLTALPADLPIKITVLGEKINA
jgi:proteasome accessory factor A